MCLFLSLKKVYLLPQYTYNLFLGMRRIVASEYVKLGAVTALVPQRHFCTIYLTIIPPTRSNETKSAESSEAQSQNAILVSAVRWCC